MDGDQAVIQADDGIDLLVTEAASSCFDLSVSVGAAVGDTIRALEEIITAAGQSLLQDLVLGDDLGAS